VVVEEGVVRRRKEGDGIRVRDRVRVTQRVPVRVSSGLVSAGGGRRRGLRSG
jgi:hypothetical protein